MKTYKFAVNNWKSDIHLPFWIFKKFPSAYAADRWATRITFKKDSPYRIICQFGEEK